MKTKIEEMIELEDMIRAEVQRVYPNLDTVWAVNRYMDMMYENSRKTAQSVVPMMEDVIRSQRVTKGA